MQDLLKTPFEEILAIQGVGEKTAEKLLEEARELMAKRGRDLEEEAARNAAAEAAAAERESQASSLDAPVAETEPEPVVDLAGGVDDRPEDVEPVVDMAPAAEGSEEPPMGTAPGEPGTEADFEDEEQAPPK